MLIDQRIQELDLIPTDKNDNTLLHAAAKNGRTEVLKLLLSKTSNQPNHVNNKSESPLHIAIKDVHVEVVEELLKFPGIDVNKPDNEGNTPLSIATNKGNAKMVQLLLAVKEIDVNQVDNEGKTPLHAAAKQGLFNMVGQLLLQDANHTIIDNDGKKPIDLARGDVNKLLKDLKPILIPRVGASPEKKKAYRGVAAKAQNTNYKIIKAVLDAGAAHYESDDDWSGYS